MLIYGLRLVLIWFAPENKETSATGVIAASLRKGNQVLSGAAHSLSAFLGHDERGEVKRGRN
jgi:hypothetical protein